MTYTRMADDLPDNPLAGILDHIVETAIADGDTSDEHIGEITADLFDRAHDKVDPPEDLFDERESLRRIRDFARQRMVGPEAVLLGVLQRALTAARWHVMIPPMIGSPKPLNTVVVNVGPSGHGKTASDDAAEDYWPADLPVFPLGTAEGMCQAFNPDDDGQPQIRNVIFSSSEIDNWAALGERAGSMIFPVMRQVVTGDTIGQKNATKGHTRIVAKRSYRAGINLSAQPGSNGAAVLFRDAPGGFPQRCVFGSVLDPEAPDEPPTGVEPYRPDPMPDFPPNAGEYHLLEFPDSVAVEIRAHQRGVLRGVPGIDPLDGHRNLSRAKVAAGLMLLEGRVKVTEDDWRIAGRIMDNSDRVRAGLIRATDQAARTANRARALATADRDEVVATTKLQRAKSTIVKHLTAKEELPRHELRKRLRSDQREHFDAAVAELADEEKLFAVDTENSTVYRIASDSHDRSTWTESPRPKPQVNDRGQRVHVDGERNVTPIDSRRSQTSARPKVSCRVWFADYVTRAVAAGAQRLDPFAVIADGAAAGYKEQSVRQAASDHDDVSYFRVGQTTTWSLIAEKNLTAEQVVAGYLAQLPANTTEIDQTDFYAYAERHGIERDTARKAIVRSGLIESVPAHGQAKSERRWLVRPAAPTEEEVS